ncbi:Dipeptidyl-peptidase 5 [Zancudomyces culisetae]|uniref:Dipeptidyl-peptidase V n=1 Tax=Zancudomyces culisetae TaxID=1213189 RepID=A0A1R1PR46_ZANCU|nr:Dipeptidyl-peptidase 5 [Zancudomyces culisetae]|eukprot:OMH83465.1 Dipeptidyl-peptidase 5 [Zancudomyces culisetae]
MKLNFVSTLLLCAVANAGQFDAPPADLPDWSKTQQFTPDHLVAVKRLDALAVSPDNKYAAYTQWMFNRTSNKVGRNIRLMSLSGDYPASDLTTFAFGTSDTSPVWLDENTVAFTAVRGSPASNIFTVSLTDKKISQVSNYTNSVSSLVYSAAAKRIAFISDVYKGLGVDESAEKAEEESNLPYSGVVYDHLFVRHWDTYIGKTRAQLFTVPIDVVDGKYSVTGKPVNLVEKYDGAWGLEPNTVVFSPDGKNVAFDAKIPGREEAWSTKADIFVVPSDGSQAPVSLTPQNPGACSAPAYSPDGTRLAWLQMVTPGYESDRNRVMIYDTKANQVSELDMGWTYSPSSVAFSQDNKSLFHITNYSVDDALFKYDFDTRANTQLTQGSSVYMMSQISSNNVILFANSLSYPNTLFNLNISSKAMQKISTENDALLDPLYLSNAYTFKFKGSLDEDVEGMMMYPFGYDPTKKYPVAFLIHGGPQSSWVRGWSYRWNPNVHSNQGFFVVVINFHGSTGYGQAFVDSIARNWGSHPYFDLMKGLDYFLEQACGADQDRQVALGASYGGYMINWIHGHTDRFKALVNHDGTFSTVSSYYSTEELYFMEHDLGTPWIPEERAQMEQYNPEHYVTNWKTPTLVVHSELDYRLPITEGLSTFTALQRQGVPSKLLYFPDENHWVLQPFNSLKWHNEVIGWIGKYTNTTVWQLTL